jgi:hypothetical protein
MPHSSADEDETGKFRQLLGLFVSLRKPFFI